MRSFIILAFCILLVPFLVSAQSVVSFTASPTSLNSGGFTDFIWDLQDAGGYSFLIPCSAGITLKKSDGSVVSCDTKISSTVKTDDYLSVFIHNVSGGTKSVTGRIIPKDAGGNDNNTVAREATVSVATHPQPIANFTASATSTVPEQPVTVSWSSAVLGGVNIQIECRDEIKISSSGYSAGLYLPCGKPIFSSDLSPSSSLPLSFTNASALRVSYKITLLPAISPGSYEGSHAADLVLDVASDVLPDPVVSLFAASSTVVNAGEEVKITWVTDKSKGANIKMACHSFITASSSKTSVLIPCDTFAFTEGLSASGQISFWFHNQETISNTITMQLLPSKKAGEYDSTRGKSLTVTVRPRGQTVLPPPPVAPPQVPLPAGSPPPVIVPPSEKIVFAQLLRRGSRGALVRTLQEFLRRDPNLYPEGIVSGYFGPVTERAVQRFQVKHGIAARGVVGYGLVGPKTRAKLNELQ